MRKKFIIVTQYFPPEIGGGAQRSFGLAEELSKEFDITVIAPFPTYLIENAKTKFKLYEEEYVNGIHVIRSFVYASDRGKFFQRIIYYLSFTVSSTILSVFKLRNIDYILTISPPIFTGITGLLTKFFKSSKFIFDIGDLWPEVAIQMGFLKNKSAIYLSKALEKVIYKNADLINVVTQNTYDKLKLEFPFIKKLLLIPNMVDINKYHKREKDEQILKELKIKNKFVVGYAGNIGSAQGLKLLTDAAYLLKNHEDIIFLIIGDGVDKNILVNEIKDKELTNVILLPPVVKDVVTKYISIFDIAIIPLIKNDLFRITIPSKLYEAMATEKPVILSVDGEARKILEENQCGFYSEPENASMLADKVLTFYSNKELLISLGSNGRKAAENIYCKEKVVKKLIENLN